MKKFFALLLVSVMLLGVMTTGISAAKPQTFTLKDLIEFAIENGYDEIYLPYDIAVNEEAVIPEGFTVVVPSNVTLDINKTLTVEGVLFVDGYLTKDSIDNIEGSFAYSKLSDSVNGKYGHDIYTFLFAPDGFYPNGYNPNYVYPHGITKKCDTHKSTYYTYCNYCRTWHCPKCDHLSGGNGFYYPHFYYYICPDCGHFYSYCDDCDEWFCYNCASHSHNGVTPPYVYPSYYCTVHSQYKTYCGYCNSHYCTYCGPHTHSHLGNKNDYIFIPGYGYFYKNSRTCEAPEASVTPGVVKSGTKVSLRTSTEGATIYYTTDGTMPNSRSNVYDGPITVNKDMTIKAIAVKNYYTASSASSFKYTILKAGSFTDTDKFDGLDEALATLLKAGIIEDAKKFNPADTFTYDELTALLSELGVDMEDVEIDASVFEDKEALTYDDFVYITYRALRAFDLIKSPRTSGSSTIKQLTHYREIPDASIYRAAYVSFLENGMFYDIHITPSDDARRVDLAIALAAVVENIG